MIPLKMSNDESKLIAGMVVAKRNLEIARCKEIAARQRLRMFYRSKYA